MVCCASSLSRVQLWNSMDWSPPGSSVHGDSSGKNTGEGSNPGLLYCKLILYHLSHQGSPRILEWVAYPSSRWSSWPRNWTRLSYIAGRFFTSWATREAHYTTIVVTKYVCVLSRFSRAWLLVILWTVAHQAPLSMGFSRQEYWSGLPCPPPESSTIIVSNALANLSSAD